MNYLSFLCLVFFFACNKKKNEVFTQNKVVEVTTLKTDTLRLRLDKDLVENDFVLIHLLDKKYKKDSILDLTYRFDFYRNSKMVKQCPIVIKDLFGENAEWYFQTGLEYQDTPKYSSFLIISNGYPACGYPQTHYLFDTKNDSFEIIDEYETFSDSGYGSYVDFFEENTNSIISRTTSFSPEEEPTSNEDMGIEEFSDSIQFKFENKTWIKTYLTPKDTIYRSKKMSFNKFHKIKE